MPTTKNVAMKKGSALTFTSSSILRRHSALLLIANVLYFQIIIIHCTSALIINSQSSGEALERFQAWNKNANRNTGNKRNGVQEIIVKQEAVPENDRDSRLCHIAVKIFPNSLHSSNAANVACRSGRLMLNHAKVSGARRVTKGDIITYSSDASDRRTNVPANPERAERFCNSRLRLIKTLSDEGSSHSPLRVLYEDNCMAIVCKPAGIHSMSWSGSFGKSLCLDEIIPLLLKPPVTINSHGTESSMVPENMEMDEPLPAPLPRHRLDRRVAGPVVVAKTRRASIEIGRSFEQKTVVKEYRAIVVGEIKIPQQQEGQHSSSDTANSSMHPPPSFTIKSDVDGRASETKVVVLGQTPCPVNGILTDLKLFPRTGRKHQLRIHCAEVLGTPILGDDLYWDHRGGGSQDNKNSDNDFNDALEVERDRIPDVSVRRRQGLYLYCKKIAINHPITDEVVSAEIPEPFRFTRTRRKALKGFKWAEDKARLLEKGGKN